MKKFLKLLAGRAREGILLLGIALLVSSVVMCIAYTIGYGAEALGIPHAPPTPDPLKTGACIIIIALAFCMITLLVKDAIKWVINLWKEANE